MGRGLSLALLEAGVETTLLDRTRRPEDTLRAALVLIAVPDDAIDGVAAELARGQAVGAATSCCTSPDSWTGTPSAPSPTPALPWAPSTRCNRLQILRPQARGYAAPSPG